MSESRWLYYAFGAALAASVVPILAKKGMRDIDPVLATALRSIVMMLFMLAACSVKQRWSGLAGLDRVSALMILLSGLAGAVSWLCGFEALSLADASKVAPIDKLSVPLAAVLAVIFLRERPSDTNWCGIFLIAIGAYLTAKK
jgi:transporter family protein